MKTYLFFILCMLLSLAAQAQKRVGGGVSSGSVTPTSSTTLTNKTLQAPVINSPTGLVKGDVGLSNLPNLDFTNPANISQSSTYRFSTDTEKTTWNGKQNALGYTPLNPANNLSDVTAATARDNLGALAITTYQSNSAAVASALAARLIAANNLSDLTDASAARTSLGLGSAALQSATAGTFAGTFSGTFSGTSFNALSYNTTNSQWKIGSLEVQGYGAANTFIGSNVYTNSGTFTRRALGYASVLNFRDNEINMRLDASGAAGSTSSNMGSYAQWKIDNSGNMAVGSALPAGSGWTGALLWVVSATGEILVNSTTLVPSSVFSVNSTTKGAIMAPRMTTTQRDAIASPAEGIQVYNLTTHTLDYYNGTVWKSVTTN
ncbi:hypothetical protein [Spirosoma validum]|uniref:Uncharacterized protein n=1 Tax=Spirosoma validum TaxID=2771355 RepID=A0A927B1V1_9BACT|nr:hypothetical protein [Spirosoma validum]MBD2753783.1 hypothetical protein [Spirosoma validum]